MSVPEYRRGGSQLVCYDMAQTLQVSILRDLPAALNSVKTDSPAILGRLVTALQSDVHALVCDILHADAIKPQFLWEVDERRRYQDMALGDCVCVQNDLLTLAMLYNDALHSILHYATDAENVGRMILAWRRYNSEIIRKIKKKENACNRNPGNFCNVNTDGNSNNNNANNAGRVRPD